MIIILQWKALTCSARMFRAAAAGLRKPHVTGGRHICPADSSLDGKARCN
jgi:hypothetical protein